MATERPSIPQVPLRAPVSGMGVRDPRTSILLWGAGSVILGLVLTSLLILGQMRILTLVLLGFFALLALSSTRRGIFLLLAFLPFMYYLRRTVLLYDRFSSFDPILVFPMVITGAMFAGVILFRGVSIYHYLRHSVVLKVAAVLMVWFALQMLNPLQGNLVLGFFGGMFFIIPMMWLAFGLFVRREDIANIFILVAAIGVITALYGNYQYYFGLSEVEEYELRAKEFYKVMADRDSVRVMSTFASLTDFARYLTVAGILLFAFYWRKKRNLLFLVLLGLLLLAMLFTASRTSFLVLLFGVLMLDLAGKKNMRQIVVRGTILVVMTVSLYMYLARFDPRRAYNQQFSDNPYVIHTVSGITHPLKEESFQTRLTVWREIVLNSLFTPIGNGVGSTTHVAARFQGGRYLEVDSYYFELFYGSGPPAAFLFTLLSVLLISRVLRLCIRFPQEYLYKVSFAILCSALLGSVFGITVRDFISGPLIWLIVGWLIREDVDRRDESSIVATSASESHRTPGRLGPVHTSPAS